MEIERRPNRILSAGPDISQQEIDLVLQAVKDGWYEGMSIHTDQFTNEFSRYIGTEHVLPVSSCTASLHLAMRCLNIGPGDEVVVPDISWVASAAPITYVGATPVFADIDPKSWCLTAETLERRITDKTKAVVVVDTYGNVPDWDPIIQLAKDRNIAIIEDTAEALGAEYKGKKAGSFGDISCFSFNVTKIAIAGQGGVFATNNKGFYDKAKSLAHHGMVSYSQKAFWSEEIGFNYQWPNILAALALGQLRRMDDLLAIKRKSFEWYQDRIGDIPGIQLNEELPGTKSSLWMVNAILSGRYKIEKEILMNELKNFNIDTRPFFYPISSQPAYKRYTQGINYEELNPVAYETSKYGISLPYAMRLTEDDVDYVSRAFLHVLSKHS